MEKLKKIIAVSLEGGWSDLGDWNAVSEQMSNDSDGVATLGSAHAIDCENTVLRSENSKQELVGLGLKNIIAVAMPDAVLVANRDKTQDVRRVVDKLRREGVLQADLLPKIHRPWGWFESLILQDTFQVKIIVVNPKSALSLQSHEFRSEHWVVVEGVAKVTLRKDTKFLGQGESIYIAQREVHRLENEENKKLVVIEVQTGSYLGEDDIIRYEDNYSRVT